MKARSLMSVKRSSSQKENNGSSSSKRNKYNRCFSFMEVSIEPGKTLKEIDSNKLKNEIKRWAKAVATYARQVSDRFGSLRRNENGDP